MIDEDALAAHLAEKWGVTAEKIAERDICTKDANGQPLPKRVLVDRIFEGRSTNGMQHGSEEQYRFFLIGVNEAGQKQTLLNTKNARFAQAEVQRYQRLGIPVMKREDRP